MKRFIAGEDRKQGVSSGFAGMVIGACGCGRLSKASKFDWPPRRILADAPIGAADNEDMRVGGAPREIVSRPQPRLGDA
jgi:molybdenum cofactor cytidylyltransferase